MVTIGNSVFENCSGLSSINIPNSVSTIGSFAFRECSGLNSITVDGDNMVYDSRNNCNALIETASNNLIKGCHNSIIPNTVACIEAYAFSGCNSLANITIPSSVTSIGESAFARCQADIYVLSKNINFPNNGIFETDDVYGFSYLNSISHDANYWKSFTPFDVPSVDIGPTAIIFRGISLQQYDDEIVSYELDESDSDYSDLIPNSSYKLFYTMNTTKGDQIQGYYTFKTAKLILNSQNPKVINSGEVIVAATTNLFDEAPNAGFEWRKIDAPKEIPSKSAEAPVYDGMIEGIVKNVDVNSYYKVRPYYKASDGTTYYGDWIGFDPSDFSYFEPTVKTYENVEINEGVAKLVGYALKGSDEITEQGFEYWNTEGSDHLTILASGQLMEAKLQNLDGGTTYGYRAYVKTNKGITYGNEYTFDMPGISIVDDFVLEPVKTNPRMGVYTINGQKIADSLPTVSSLPRGIYIVDGRKMVIK